MKSVCIFVLGVLFVMFSGSGIMLLPKEQSAEDKIIEGYQRKLKESPDDIETHRAYQNFMRQCGGINNIREEYLGKLKSDPQNPLYYYLYGRLLEGAELERHFKKALELENKSPNPELRFWLYFGLGQFYLDTKRYKEALQNFESGLKLKPDSLDVQHQMALLFYTTDETNKALDSWNKILKINPDYLDAYLGKGILYKGKSNYDSAIKELEIILKKDPTYWKAYEPLIQCYHVKKDYEKAEELRTMIKELYLKQYEYKIDFGYLELIVIDIINIKQKIIIVKERITPFPHPVESRFAYADYYFEVYEEKIDKTPKVIYEVYGYDKEGKREGKDIFRLNRVICEIFSDKAKRETVKEYKEMPSYPALLNEVIEREKDK
jgi:tetratricopeptide (TPR) repeat protein